MSSYGHVVHTTAKQGPVVRSLVSANRWLRGVKTYRFPWYLTLVSANHASSNPGQVISRRRKNQNFCEMSKMKTARAKRAKLLFFTIKYANL